MLSCRNTQGLKNGSDVSPWTWRWPQEVFKDSFYSALAWLAVQSAILAMINSSGWKSVTRWYCAKVTTQATIMRSSLQIALWPYFLHG